jgi:hypothetical protein
MIVSPYDDHSRFRQVAQRGFSSRRSEEFVVNFKSEFKGMGGEIVSMDDDFNKGLSILKNKGIIEQVLKKHGLLNDEL